MRFSVNKIVSIVSGYHGAHKMGQFVVVDLAKGWHNADGIIARISGKGDPIDIKIKDQLGRSWQCSTIQVDFNLPERFKMTYTGADNSDHQPIMIHRALMGSLERFIGVLIEHYAGVFPLWFAPVQARILNITDDQAEYSEEVYKQLRKLGVRIEKDLRNEKLNYKIREAQFAKMPYMLIVGDKEKDDGTVTVRLRDGKNLPPMSVEDFAAMVDAEVKEGRGY